MTFNVPRPKLFMDPYFEVARNKNWTVGWVGRSAWLIHRLRCCSCILSAAIRVQPMIVAWNLEVVLSFLELGGPLEVSTRPPKGTRIQGHDL